MISTAKLACVQIVIIGLAIANEAIRTLAFADYIENPVAMITPLLVLALLAVWIWTLGGFVRDGCNSKAIPAWCKIVQSIIGIGFAFYLIAAARFVVGY